MSCWSLAIFLLGVAGTMANEDSIIRFLGVGYDLLQADPDATASGGVDPGYRPTRRIIAIDSNASQVEQVKRHACQNRTTWSTIYDEKSYQGKFNSDVSVSGGVNTPIVEARFGLSAGYSEAQQKTTKERNVLFDDESVCNYGQGRIKMSNEDLKLTEEFQRVVCALPTTYDKNAYLAFLKNWGTHVVIRVDVGTRQRNRTTVKLNSFMESVTDQVTAGVVAGGSVSVVSSELRVDMSKFHASDKFYEELTGETSSRLIGTQDLPEPIGAEVRSVDQVLNQSFFRQIGIQDLSGPIGAAVRTVNQVLNQTLFGSNAPCISAQLKNLAAIKTNVMRALDDYPTNRGVSPPTSDGIISNTFNFPLGTYGLYSVRDVGCPKGSWSGGWRRHDCEDNNNKNQWSSPLHVAGTFDRNIRTDFCIKEYPSLSAFDMKWPRGEYCVIKYRNCPEGFREGYVYWDDDDKENKNDLGGVIPDGTFDRNTRIDYCCRKDGNIKSPIFLPTTSPFILLPATRYGCQEVNGMRVTLEWIYWDSEDSDNKSQVSGDSPYVEGQITLYFCYYEKK